MVANGPGRGEGLRMGRPVVYVDMAFALNLTVDLAWLWCAGVLAGAPLRPGRLAAAAALGAAAATAALWPGGRFLTRWPVRLVGTVGLGLLAYGARSWQQAARRSLWLWMTGAAMAGGVLALLGGEPGQPLQAPGAALLALGVALVTGGGCLLWRGTASRREAAALRAELEVATDAGRARLPALVDSGNLLTDPVSGTAVAVVEAAALAACLPAALWQAAAAGRAADAVLAGAVRLLPYATVGGGGLLPAVRARVQWRLAAGETGMRPSALIALAPRALHPGGEVRALLPAAWLAGERAQGEG